MMARHNEEVSMSPKKATQRSAKRTSATAKRTSATAERTSATAQRSNGFTDEEKAAMKEHARELKIANRRGRDATKADGESDVLAKISEMSPSDRDMAGRLHTLVKEAAPDLTPRTWYGMPAYAKNGDVVCFFQPAQKFKTRYATFGFSDKAALDDGDFWPSSYALTKLTPATEQRITALVKQAVS
jgi:uncharacterized protein YdhG (YjbR/CyaY superfamily)